MKPATKVPAKNISKVQSKPLQMAPSQKKKYEQLVKGRATAKLSCKVPAPVWYRILLFQLEGPKSILRFSIVCRTFRGIVNAYEQPLWFILYQQRFSGKRYSISKWVSLYNESNVWKEKYMEQVMKISKKVAAKTAIDFKKVFTKHYTALKKNLKQIIVKLKLKFSIKGIADTESIVISAKMVKYFENALMFPLVFVKIDKKLHSLKVPIILTISVLDGTFTRDFLPYSLTKSQIKCYEDKLISLFKCRDLLFGVFGDGTIAFMYFSVNYVDLFKSMDPYIFTGPAYDDIDSKYGLHDYFVSIELRNLKEVIWSIDWQKVDIQGVHNGYAELVLVSSNPSDSRHSDAYFFKGDIGLSWKSAAFSGTIQDYCYVDLTVKDEFNNPFHAGTLLICVNRQGNLSATKEEYKIEYLSEDKRVQCIMSFEKDLNEPETRAKDIVIYIKKEMINQYFHTKY